MMGPMLRLLAPGGAQAKLSVLIFHRVLAEKDPLFPGEVDAREFDAICGWLASWFRVMPLDEAVRSLRSGTLPRAALAITFDDGYADNEAVALPILRRHGLMATFFIATGYLDGGRMWNDTVIESLRACEATELDLAGAPAASLGRLSLGAPQDWGARRGAIEAVLKAIKYLPDAQRLDCVAALSERSGVALPAGPMMSSAQVRALRGAGMQIGAHTVSHPILAKLGPAQAEREIADSKHALEALLGEAVTQFAYPNGKAGVDYSAQSVALVQRLGFEAAVSTEWGVCRPDTPRFELPRFTPWDRTPLRFGLRMAGNLRRPEPVSAPQMEPLN